MRECRVEGDGLGSSPSREPPPCRRPAVLVCPLMASIRFEKGAVEKVALEGAVKTAKSVRCPKHGKTATVSKVRKTPKGFSFELSGCCDDLVSRAQAALGS